MMIVIASPFLRSCACFPFTSLLLLDVIIGHFLLMVHLSGKPTDAGHVYYAQTHKLVFESVSSRAIMSQIRLPNKYSKS